MMENDIIRIRTECLRMAIETRCHDVLTPDELTAVAQAYYDYITQGRASSAKETPSKERLLAAFPSVIPLSFRQFPRFPKATDDKI